MSLLLLLNQEQTQNPTGRNTVQVASLFLRAGDVAGGRIRDLFAEQRDAGKRTLKDCKAGRAWGQTATGAAQERLPYQAAIHTGPGP